MCPIKILHKIESLSSASSVDTIPLYWWGYSQRGHQMKKVISVPQPFSSGWAVAAAFLL